MEQMDRKVLNLEQREDEPSDWRGWASVQKSALRIEKVCPHIWKGVFLYCAGNSRFGFLTKDRIVTEPNYTIDYRLVSKVHGLVVIRSFKPYPNNLVLIDLKTGKELFSDFACYLQSPRIGKELFAYRLDDPKKVWPDNMKWGILHLSTLETVLQPKQFPVDRTTRIEKQLCEELQKMREAKK